MQQGHTGRTPPNATAPQCNSCSRESTAPAGVCCLAAQQQAGEAWMGLHALCSVVGPHQLQQQLQAWESCRHQAAPAAWVAAAAAGGHNGRRQMASSLAAAAPAAGPVAVHCCWRRPMPRMAGHACPPLPQRPPCRLAAAQAWESQAGCCRRRLPPPAPQRQAPALPALAHS